MMAGLVETTPKTLWIGVLAHLDGCSGIGIGDNYCSGIHWLAGQVILSQVKDISGIKSVFADGIDKQSSVIARPDRSNCSEPSIHSRPCTGGGSDLID